MDSEKNDILKFMVAMINGEKAGVGDFSFFIVFLLLTWFTIGIFLDNSTTAIEKDQFPHSP